MPSGRCELHALPVHECAGILVAQQVVLVADRGPYSAFTSVNTGKYHAAYVNDDWEISKYATLSLACGGNSSA